MQVYSKDMIIQDSATTPSDGEIFYSNSEDLITIEIMGTASSFTVLFEGLAPSGNWYPINGIRLSDYSKSNNSTSLNELWQISLISVNAFRAKISDIADGNITVNLRSVNTNGATNMFVPNDINAELPDNLSVTLANDSINSMCVDSAGFNSSNTVFGDKYVSERIDDISLQFQYNISAFDVVQTTTGSGAITHERPMAVLSTTDNTNSSAQIKSLNNVRYKPAREANIYFTAKFTSGVIGSKQLIGLFDDNNGYAIGFIDNNFCVIRRSGGVDEVVAQENFNIDTLDGTGDSGYTLSKENINVFRIRFGYLGAAPIIFELQLNNGFILPFHMIKWANNNPTTHILQPYLPFTAKVENTTNDSNIVLKSASISAGLSESYHDRGLRSRRQSISVEKSISANTLTNLMTIRSKPTFHGIQNKIATKPLAISVSTEGNKPVEILAYNNASVGGTPNFQDVNTNESTLEYDTAGTTVSGGTLRSKFMFQKTDSAFIPITPIVSIIPAGFDIVIAAFSKGDSDIDVALYVEELF